MPIGFRSRKARNHLLRIGSVYTYRLTKRKKDKETTWANTGRRTPKIADVYVTLIDVMTVEELRPYRGYSGFNTFEGWKEEIQKLNPGKDIASIRGYLYRVKVIG